MPAYLRILRFPYYSTGMTSVPGYKFSSHGIPSISPIQQGRFMREVYEPSLAVRIDGERYIDYKYDVFEKSGQYINGQDIGVHWPGPDTVMGRIWRDHPEGPRIAQHWYEVQPGSHRLEIAAIYWFEQRKPGLYYNIGFDVEPDGDYTFSCQWQNHPNHLILIRGEDVVMSSFGVIFPSGDIGRLVR